LRFQFVEGKLGVVPVGIEQISKCVADGIHQFVLAGLEDEFELGECGIE
jgi:hypothetical protein